MNPLLRRLALAALPLAVAVASARAGMDDNSLSPTGSVQRVASELTKDGSRISHTVQLSDGSSSCKPIPGTEDAAPDTAPVISTEPNDSGRAAAVWVRKVGIDDQIALSIYDGHAWGPIQTIPGEAGVAEADPRIVWGTSGILHIMWRVDSVVSTRYWWAQYDSAGRPLSGPSPAPDAIGETVGDNGGPINPNSSIGSSQVFFSFVRPITAGGGMVLFGGRDEPHPIGCGILFGNPRGVTSADATRGLRVGNRVAFTFRSGGKLYYTVREVDLGYWLPYRMINLTADLPESRARWLVQEMLDRITPTVTP